MKQPNLLFIYTDEQAFNTLAAYGNSRIHMPNLNRLADESVVFDQAYVTQPVCTPSRSSLLTGLYPHANGCTRNNLVLPSDIDCLPEMLTDGDYATAHIGKWHLGDELFAQHGFQEWVSIEDAYNRYFTEGRDRNCRSDYHRFLIENGFSPQKGDAFRRGEAAKLPEAYGKPAFVAREASRFLREHAGAPFILYVNFLEPHMPFFGPRDDQYDPGAIPLPKTFDHEPDAATTPLKVQLLREQYRRFGQGPLPLESESDWRRLIANYWGLCSLVDTHVGTVLDTLEQCGREEDTIVVFTSDHGDMMGAHRLIAKGLMYEEAVRVPLMMRVPGTGAGRRITGPVSQIDVVPTLLDLLGQPCREPLHGKSLRPWLERESAPMLDPVFIEWNGHPNGQGEGIGNVDVPDWMTAMAEPDRIQAAMADSVRSVVTSDGWKFNCSLLGEHELYRIADDPGETGNLYDDNKAMARRLRDAIVAWQQTTNDTLSLPTLD